MGLGDAWGMLGEVLCAREILAGIFGDYFCTEGVTLGAQKNGSMGPLLISCAHKTALLGTIFGARRALWAQNGRTVRTKRARSCSKIKIRCSPLNMFAVWTCCGCLQCLLGAWCLQKAWDCHIWFKSGFCALPLASPALSKTLHEMCWLSIKN